MYVIKGMDVLPGNVVRKSVLLITLLFLNPLGHIFQYFRTDGFFQLPVFGQCAFFAGLQQMVQVRIGFYSYIFVSVFADSLLDGCKVHSRVQLNVLLSV